MSLLLKIVVVATLLLEVIPAANAFQHPNTAYDYKKLPDSVNLLKNTATEYYYQENYDKAVKTYKLFVDKIFDLNYEIYAVDAYEYLIDVLASRDDLPLQSKIVSIINYCDAENRIDLTPVKYSYLAQCYLMEGINDSATHYYSLATYHCKKNNLPLVETNLNVGFSFIKYFEYDLKNTLLYTLRAEKIVQERLIPSDIQLPYNFFAIQIEIYKSLGYKDKALKSQLNMINLIENDPSTSPSVLGNQYHELAVQFDELGDFDNAIIYYEKSINKNIEYNLNEYDILYSQYCIGSSNEEQGKKSLAKNIYIDVLREAMNEDVQRHDIKKLLIQTYQSLAFLYLYDNQQDSLLYCIEEINKLHKDCNIKAYRTYNLISQFNIYTHNYEEARKHIHLGIESSKNKTNTDLCLNTCTFNNHLVTISLAEKKYQEALSYCQQSLAAMAPTYTPTKYDNPSFDKIRQKRVLIPTLHNKLKVLEILYAQKDPNVSPQLLLSTIKLGIQALEYKNKTFKSKSSQTYWLNRQAIPLFEKAIEIALYIYKRTHDHQYLDEAFMLSERSKSIMMMNALQEQNATSFGGIPTELIEREQELERELEVIEKLYQDAVMSGDEAEMQYQDSLRFAYHHEKIKLLHQFEADYPKYYELKHIVKKTSIQEVQEALDEQTVLIEYFQGKERTYIFTVTKDTAFVRNFKHTKVYDVQLASFQNLLIDLQRAQENLPATCRQFIRASSELYALLLAESLVPSKQRLLLIPDGQLAYLPFEVLLVQPLSDAANSQQQAFSFAQLPYLLRQYTTNYNYSAQLFLEQRKRRAKQQKATLLGLAPYYNNRQAPDWRNPYEQQLRRELPELEGAVRELEFLQQQLKLKGNYLYGADASETYFKQQAPPYDILHLAVHGLVNHESPELSGLALEEDNSRTQDNILYAYEIKQLELQARLVVLSACETGIGKYQHGEGVMSIGRSFMYAGVPSIMTTLWNLNDQTGSIIIEKFYEHLDAGMAKDEALRQAKLYYLETMQGSPLATHPALWACFVQVGDYTPLTIQHDYLEWYLLGLGLLVALLLMGVFMLKNRKK
jgi:CHAT domain-containing protein